MQDNSTPNYFEIFQAADREMIHSAMLADVLLQEPFFQKWLMPDVTFPAGFKPLKEKPFPESRLRADIIFIDADAKSFLVVENKFKSFPTREQLKKYNEAIKKANLKVAKYLVAFNSSTLCDSVAREAGWQAVTYSDVRDAIGEFLEQNPDTSARKRLLLSEYRDYLDRYIKHYEAITKKPALLNGLKMAHDYNLFRRLFLGQIALDLEKQPEEFVISANSGGATEPLLDIYPPGWNKIPYTGSAGKKEHWPKIFMQLQGDKIKFYLRWREAGTSKKKELDPEIVKHILEYIGGMEGLEGIDLKQIKSRMESSNASCTICERPFILTGNIGDSVRQVLDFYHEIDKAVKKRGQFL